MKQTRAPIAMGLIMGPMMLWMLHGQLVGDGGSSIALLVFIGAHALLLFAVVAGGIFAARLSPQLQSLLNRLHRPSLAHLTIMLSSAVIAATVVHFIIHGFA